MHRRQHLGAWGEDVAAARLVADGYVVRERNWRVADGDVRGEIDLIVQRGRTLAFVEVKTRTSEAFGTPADAVSWDKRRRLRRLAGAYLARNPHAGPVRGDVVAVTRPRRRDLAPDVDVLHLEGVW